ncbi:hypothetical protein CRYUN_Cryun18bG0027000 [Craigia yunnanensis]
MVVEDFAEKKVVQMGTSVINVFCSTLEGYVVCKNLKDSLIWKGSSNGEYSAKQYCKFALSVEVIDTEIWKMVWMRFTPPKVEVFCWQLLRDR